MPARVLVIEDNPENLQLMDYLLRAFGHEVMTATSGEDALDEVHGLRPDLIVCDVQLPGIDGHAVVGRLKASATTRPIPTIAVTAYAMAGDRKRALEAGFDGYIAKPINPETFVTEIEEHLRSELRGSITRSPGVVPAPRRRRPATRARILAVDDSRSNLGLLRTMLEPRGYAFIGARSARHALRVLESNPPDLVLSDVHMADGGGFDLIQAMKSSPALERIPVVFISSTVWADADWARGMSLGAEAFLIRPIEADELGARIESVLHGERADGADRRRRR
jgi:two-component system cell cycle response regulator